MDDGVYVGDEDAKLRSVWDIFPTDLGSNSSRMNFKIVWRSREHVPRNPTLFAGQWNPNIRVLCPKLCEEGNIVHIQAVDFILILFLVESPKLYLTEKSLILVYFQRLVNRISKN